MNRLSFYLLLFLLAIYLLSGAVAWAALLGRIDMPPVQPPNLRSISHDLQLASRAIALFIGGVAIYHATTRVARVFWSVVFANTIISVAWFCLGYLLSADSRHFLWAIQMSALVLVLLVIAFRQHRDNIDLFDLPRANRTPAGAV